MAMYREQKEKKEADKKNLIEYDRQAQQFE